MARCLTPKQPWAPGCAQWSTVPGCGVPLQPDTPVPRPHGLFPGRPFFQAGGTASSLSDNKNRSQANSLGEATSLPLPPHQLSLPAQTVFASLGHSVVSAPIGSHGLGTSSCARATGLPRPESVPSFQPLVTPVAPPFGVNSVSVGGGGRRAWALECLECIGLHTPSQEPALPFLEPQEGARPPASLSLLPRPHVSPRPAGASVAPWGPLGVAGLTLKA